MKKYLHLEVPALELDEDTQKSFCNKSKKCVLVDGCAGCLYAKENLKHFQKYFSHLKK